MITKVNLQQKLSLFSDHWSPKIVADLNDSHVKLVKVRGQFVWHQHADEDELFLILHGRLIIELRDATLTLDPGEFVVIPRGVEHRPVAREEVHLLLVEPKVIKHTGDVVEARTVTDWQRL